MYLGRGIHLHLDGLDVGTPQGALVELLTNPTYKANMERVTKLFQDRLETPVQTALWWTEYVLRHEDTVSLKPLAMRQAWYERRLLDVWLLSSLCMWQVSSRPCCLCGGALGWLA